MATLNGRAVFHDIFIRLSYRRRGILTRTHTYKKHINNTLGKFNPPPKKIRVVIILRRIIIPYSVIKIRANAPPLYSILNPDTISDSPSDISKGVRLDSAIHKVTQNRNTGTENIEYQNPNCISFIASKSIDRVKLPSMRMNRNKHTS